MSSKWTKELEIKIIARAWKDESFKQKLLKNPKEAFGDYGVKWDSDVKVTSFEESKDQVYIILPQRHSKMAKLTTEQPGNAVICPL